MSTPIKMWDEHGHEFTNKFDALNKPVESWVDEGSSDQLINLMVYGDDAGLTSLKDDNLKCQMIRLFDQSRVVKNTDFDFKGNLLSNEKQFATNYKTTIN